MGFYDRDYYRDETRGSGFFSGAAPACKFIILVNVIVFVGEMLSPQMREFIKSLKAGDKVDLIYTEAVVISVEPSPKK